jgi:Macrocin-O-methyltransferase (TylF)
MCGTKKSTDVGFQERLDVFKDSVDIKEYTDDPFLFLKRQRFTEYLQRIKLFEMILDVKGSIVECGVHKGGSLMLYYHLSSVMEPYAFNRKIYGFDTFEGFRSISKKDSPDIHESMFSDTSYDILAKAIEIHDLNRSVPEIEKCVLIKGDATATIPPFIKNHPELVIALLYLDFDLYEPTKVALQHFLPLVPKGGIVAFDELGSKKWVGETQAFKEHLDLKNIGLKKRNFDPWASYFVVGE